MKINIITIFPWIIEPFLKISVIKKGIEKGLIEFNLINIRDFAEPPHYKVDDTIYGGSPGMLLMIEPVVKAIESCQGYRILLSPQGRVFNQEMARKLAKKKEITLIAGRYEGFDERISNFIDEELSIGDFILSGGEIAAAVVADTIARLIPGIVGNQESVLSESFSKNNFLLDYDQYTKPRVFRNLCVPDVLISGNHAKISDWRKENRLNKTKKKRPDLWKKWLEARGKKNAK